MGSVRFSCPLHDKRFACVRWVEYRLHSLVFRFGMDVALMVPQGCQVETGVLVISMLFARTALTGSQRLCTTAMQMVVAPMVIPLLNAMAWTVTRLAGNGSMMPGAHIMVLRKR